MSSRSRWAAAVAGAALVAGGLAASPAVAGSGVAGAAPTGSSTAAVAATAAASTGLHWAPAASARIHPGVVVTVAGVKCLAGFVLTDGTHVYLTVPASCTGVSSGKPTDGCVEAQVPVGLPITIHGASRKGTLVYSSFTRMQLRSETNSNRCHNNSLSLIRIARRDIRRTNPSVPAPVGGPSGLATTAPPPLDVQTLYLGMRTQAPLTGTTSGGWAHTVAVVGAVNTTDLGGPVLTSSGRALGMVTLLPQSQGGDTTVSDLAKELTALRHTTGFAHVHLARGTVPFTAPPSVPGL